MPKAKMKADRRGWRKEVFSEGDAAVCRENGSTVIILDKIPFIVIRNMPVARVPTELRSFFDFDRKPPESMDAGRFVYLVRVPAIPSVGATAERSYFLDCELESRGVWCNRRGREEEISRKAELLSIRRLRDFMVKTVLRRSPQEEEVLSLAKAILSERQLTKSFNSVGESYRKNMKDAVDRSQKTSLPAPSSEEDGEDKSGEDISVTSHAVSSRTLEEVMRVIREAEGIPEITPNDGDIISIPLPPISRPEVGFAGKNNNPKKPAKKGPKEDSPKHSE